VLGGDFSNRPARLGAVSRKVYCLLGGARRRYSAGVNFGFFGGEGKDYVEIRLFLKFGWGRFGGEGLIIRTLLSLFLRMEIKQMVNISGLANWI
jgi:hypothetical protein